MASLFPASLDGFVAALTQDEITKLALPLAILAVLLLIPHGITAKMLAPQPTAGRVIAATVMHVIGVVVAVAFKFVALVLLGPLGLPIAALIILLVFGFVTAGIYKFSLGRGILYNFLVVLVGAGLAWVVMTFIVRDPELLAQIYGREGAKKESVENETAGTPGPSPSVLRYGTVQEAQAAAVARYPDLGKAGSEFNKRFLEKHSALKAKDPAALASPDWPMTIATQVAAEMETR